MDNDLKNLLNQNIKSVDGEVKELTIQKENLGYELKIKKETLNALKITLSFLSKMAKENKLVDKNKFLGAIESARMIVTEIQEHSITCMVLANKGKDGFRLTDINYEPKSGEDIIGTYGIDATEAMIAEDIDAHFNTVSG